MRYEAPADSDHLHIVPLINNPCTDDTADAGAVQFLRNNQTLVWNEQTLTFNVRKWNLIPAALSVARDMKYSKRNM